jgi:hypothetical protein
MFFTLAIVLFFLPIFQVNLGWESFVRTSSL